MNSTTAGQAPNKQTFVTAHYFKPHDKRPSFSSVMSGFLTRWMKEPELYTPWSTRRTCASKGSHPRCLSVNVPLNSSNLRSFSLVLSPVTPQSIEGTHTSHVRSVSTPSSGSSPSGEATRLKLVTCARTPNEQRVTVAETISSTASTTPSSEIPGDWEEHVERLDTHLGEDEEQPSGSLAAKSTITQPVNAEWANIYSNEESGLEFDPYDEEWDYDYSTGPRLTLTKLSAMEEYEHLLAVENNNIPSQWFEDLVVPLDSGYAWSDGSSDSGSDSESSPPQTPTQPVFDAYPEAGEENMSPVLVLVATENRVKPVLEFKPIGFRWSEYPDDDDGLPELPIWA